MSEAIWQFLGTLTTAGLATIGIWLSVRRSGRQARTDAAQNLMDQVQEERAELKRDNVVLKAKIEKLEADMRASYGRELLRDDFIQSLRQHIRQGLGPPPPEWPEALRHG